MSTWVWVNILVLVAALVFGMVAVKADGVEQCECYVWGFIGLVVLVADLISWAAMALFAFFGGPA
jgi:hypothetical protein